MPEKRVIVEGLTIKYEGVFNMKELYDVIEHWTKEKGYDKVEKKNFEQVLKTGRDIMIETWPTKAFSDYARNVMKIVIHVKKMKDVVVTKDGMDIKMNQGLVNINFNGFLITDHAGMWEGKPFFYFMRTVIDRWIYPLNTDKFAGAIKSEANELYTVVKGYLNLNRH